MSWLSEVRQHPIYRGTTTILVPVSILTGLFTGLWWILGLLADQGRVNQLQAEADSILQMVGTWPDHPSWKWAMVIILVIIFIGSAWWAGRRLEKAEAADRTHRERELAAVSSLLQDATKLPLLMARKDMQQTIINEFERRSTAVEKSRGEVNKWFRGLNENGKPIPMGDGMAPTQPHELTDTLKTLAQYVDGVEENDVPEFKPSRPHPEPNGPSTVFLVSKNNGYMETVSTYIWDTQQIQKKLQRHLRDEQDELRQLDEQIRMETKRLVVSKDD